MSEGIDTAPGPDRRPAQGPADPPVRPPFLVAVQGHAPDLGRSVRERIRQRFPSVEPLVFESVLRGGEAVLVPLDGPAEDRGSAPGQVGVPGASQGAVPGYASPIASLLKEAVARDACGAAIVAAEPHDEEADWLGLLLAPVIEGQFDLVCPAYRRRRTEGAINTGIAAPLLRALYGQALRQPLGTELALSRDEARRLLGDADWARRPAAAGSDAWVLARTLGGSGRVAQSWLGAWPRPAAAPEEASQTLARAVGLLFAEMEADPERWQRTAGARPVATFGDAAFEPGGDGLDPGPLHEAFAIGVRDLGPIWSLVLPPATMLVLDRAARQPIERFEIPDSTWARVVFDFSVAYLTRVIERRQLLLSMTPLYLGWLAGLARSAAALDDPGFEKRLEALGSAFEQERRYLIRRWRWPDDFNP